MGALILHAGRKITPEQQLVVAILAQAFNDMLGNASGSDHIAQMTENRARQAMIFLTERHGNHARWRNDLCGFLDLDGDALSEQVRKILDSDLPWPEANGAGKVYSHEKIARAREQWRHLKKRL